MANSCIEKLFPKGSRWLTGEEAACVIGVLRNQGSPDRSPEEIRDLFSSGLYVPLDANNTIIDFVIWNPEGKTTVQHNCNLVHILANPNASVLLNVYASFDPYAANIVPSGEFFANLKYDPG